MRAAAVQLDRLAEEDSLLTGGRVPLTVWPMSSQDFKRRRQALGYSQSELSVLLGVHRRTISKWERQVHRIPETAVLLLEYLKPKKKGTKR